MSKIDAPFMCIILFIEKERCHLNVSLSLYIKDKKGKERMTTNDSELHLLIDEISQIVYLDFLENENIYVDKSDEIRALSKSAYRRLMSIDQARVLFLQYRSVYKSKSTTDVMIEILPKLVEMETKYA